MGESCVSGFCAGDGGQRCRAESSLELETVFSFKKQVALGKQSAGACKHCASLAISHARFFGLLSLRKGWREKAKVCVREYAAACARLCGWKLHLRVCARCATLLRRI